MNVFGDSGRLLPQSRVKWAAFIVLLIFTLTIGTAIHNHSFLGSDGGAEKVSQSKFTCPACVFDGKPITVVVMPVMLHDSGALTLLPLTETSFEKILAETSSSRAPPLV